MQSKSDAERVLEKLDAKQKANFGNLMEAHMKGGREGLRAALKAMYPNVPDKHPPKEPSGQ